MKVEEKKGESPRLVGATYHHQKKIHFLVRKEIPGI